MSSPKVFVTKVWGFDPVTYPVLGFSKKGARKSFLRESSPGDWVVFAGTKGYQTPPDQQGRLLGKAQLGPDYVDVEKVLRSLGTPIDQDHFHENGEYYWPFGLPMIVAEKFVGQPDTKEVLGDYLQGMVWASTARDIELAMGRDAWEAIMQLETESVEIAEIPEFKRQLARSKALQLSVGGGNTGPGPSSERSGSRSAEIGGTCYMLELKGTERVIFKIGYAKNLEDRVSSLNKGLLTEVSGLLWELVMYQPLPTAQEAFDFEQEVHKKMRDFLVPGETEVYEAKKKEISVIWTTVLTEAKWANK